MVDQYFQVPVLKSSKKEVVERFLKSMSRRCSMVVQNPRRLVIGPMGVGILSFDSNAKGLPNERSPGDTWAARLTGIGRRRR